MLGISIEVLFFIQSGIKFSSQIYTTLEINQNKNWYCKGLEIWFASKLNKTDNHYTFLSAR